MSAISASPTVKAASLYCPNCGGPIQLKGFAHTLTAVCPSCGSILDASTPLLKIVQTAQTRQQIQPAVPLGARAKLDGREWQAIGFQIRTMTADGERYEWSEYVLFNPYRGFRYLTEYQGHWNFIRVLSRLPDVQGRRAQLDGVHFRLFQTGTACTSYVMGEFPWRVRLNEQVNFQDYISPPEILSAENTAEDNEITWSLGHYMSGRDIWKAFNLKGAPPPARGVFANQPSPTAHKVAGLWKVYVLLVVALLLMMGALKIVRRGTEAFQGTYTFNPRSAAEGSFVTQPFSIPGDAGNVEINIDTNLENASAYFDIALINADDGHAFVSGREVSYYRGQDSDGNWSEGKASNSVDLSSVPDGRYYLRIEPQMTPGANTPELHYTITVRRGVLSWSFFFVAVVLLAIPPLISTWRRFSFERRRWQESDLSGFPVLKGTS